jgi:hypothetical protein
MKAEVSILTQVNLQVVEHADRTRAPGTINTVTGGELRALVPVQPFSSAPGGLGRPGSGGRLVLDFTSRFDGHKKLSREKR